MKTLLKLFASLLLAQLTFWGQKYTLQLTNLPDDLFVLLGFSSSLLILFSFIYLNYMIWKTEVTQAINKLKQQL